MLTDDQIKQCAWVIGFTGTKSKFFTNLVKFAREVEKMEREECAKIFDASPHAEMFGSNVADAIRARSTDTRNFKEEPQCKPQQ